MGVWDGGWGRGVQLSRVSRPGGNCPRGKLFRGNYPEGKIPEGNFLGEKFIGGSFMGGSCSGGNIQGLFSRGKVRGSIALEEFHGKQLSKRQLSRVP